MNDPTYLQARIDATKAAITAYEDALLAFASSNIQEYTLDTGQSLQRVKRADIGDLNRVLGSLENRCAALETRLNGCGTTHVRPAW